MVSMANEHENALLHFENACRQNGLSITPQRTAIFKELVSSSEHPSAAGIFKKIREYYDNISLDTVSRTLLTFHEIGLAKIVESSGDPRRFDPNLAPHHHFRCVTCGRIVDFEDASYDALEVPRAMEEKYVIKEKRVHLEGFCDTCRSPDRTDHR